MPPRQSDAAAASSAQDEGAAAGLATALTSLPAPLVHDIFARLPTDLRARCACVCRAWRAAVAERALWARLDVSRTTGGVTCRVDDAMLRAVAARAGGGLQALDVSDRRVGEQPLRGESLSEELLLEIAAANAGTLRELALGDSVPSTFVEALARAAPQLRVFDAGVIGDCRDVCRVLRGEPPFSALRVGNAVVQYEEEAPEARQDMHALLAAVASHATFTKLHLRWFPLQLPAELDAVVDVALPCRLQHLVCDGCYLDAESAPTLARLLSSTTLTTLEVSNESENHYAPLLDAPSAALLSAALRANSTLTSLTLEGVCLWHCPDAAADAATLLGAGGAPEPAGAEFFVQHMPHATHSCRCARRAGRRQRARAARAVCSQLPLGRCGAGPAVRGAAGQHAPAQPERGQQ
jgi:hypothetical protein